MMKCGVFQDKLRKAKYRKNKALYIFINITIHIMKTQEYLHITGNKIEGSLKVRG